MSSGLSTPFSKNFIKIMPWRFLMLQSQCKGCSLIEHSHGGGRKPIWFIDVDVLVCLK